MNGVRIFSEWVGEVTAHAKKNRMAYTLVPRDDRTDNLWAWMFRARLTPIEAYRAAVQGLLLVDTQFRDPLKVNSWTAKVLETYSKYVAQHPGMDMRSAPYEMWFRARQFLGSAYRFGWPAAETAGRTLSMRMFDGNWRDTWLGAMPTHEDTVVPQPSYEVSVQSQPDTWTAPTPSHCADPTEPQRAHLAMDATSKAVAELLGVTLDAQQLKAILKVAKIACDAHELSLLRIARGRI